MIRTPSLRALLLVSVLALAACTSPLPVNQTPTATPLVVLPAPGSFVGLTVKCPDLENKGFVATTTHGRVCASTQPGATLTIAAWYCLDNQMPDQSPALMGTFQADTHGYYEWNWHPQAPEATCVQDGSYTSGSVTVTATLKGLEVSETSSL